ncbi:PREDICTED: uncharacterized protein LOC109226167 [Nicotiana attenuata]|uniref:uncharacterized protein LOC109226167 n=1 Tax=Nicotiana attenuata TaxID=49451 RepID=UPI000904E9FB|nr:PREDICTED: uncharacterized protein LOC109226167 [Nicotiana attenuata]
MVQKIIKAKRHIEEAGISMDEINEWNYFSIKKWYNRIRGQYQNVTWRRLTCNNLGAPKWMFILNLAIQNRLLTRSRLHAWGITDEKSCPICNEAEESIEHLMFKCRTTGEIWSKILRWQGISRAPMEWQREIQWAENNATGSNAAAQVYRLALACAVYHIWNERNNRIFQDHQKTVEMIVRQIVIEVAIRGSMNRKIGKKIEEIDTYCKGG